MNILLTEEQIHEGVSRLAADILEVYGERPLTILGIMTGSIMLLADLIRLLDMPLRVGVIQTSSYRDGDNRSELMIHAQLMPDIQDRDVLLIDDIFDTGHTMAGVIARIQEMRPRSVRSAVLLKKSGCQEVETEPDFVTFEIPDAFVIGYGLDYCDEYRHLPFIGSLESSEMPEGSSS